MPTPGKRFRRARSLASEESEAEEMEVQLQMEKVGGFWEIESSDGGGSEIGSLGLPICFLSTIEPDPSSHSLIGLHPIPNRSPPSSLLPSAPLSYLSYERVSLHPQTLLSLLSSAPLSHPTKNLNRSIRRLRLRSSLRFSWLFGFCCSLLCNEIKQSFSSQSDTQHSQICLVNHF
ncbi:PREDICTED: uncharacterized protein LOC101297682 [Fragaria vesca subsp. vesca]